MNVTAYDLICHSQGQNWWAMLSALVFFYSSLWNVAWCQLCEFSPFEYLFCSNITLQYHKFSSVVKSTALQLAVITYALKTLSSHRSSFFVETWIQLDGRHRVVGRNCTNFLQFKPHKHFIDNLQNTDIHIYLIVYMYTYPLPGLQKLNCDNPKVFPTIFTDWCCHTV